MRAGLLLMCCLLLVPVCLVQAQDEEAASPAPVEEVVNLRKFDSDEWDKITRSIDYSELPPDFTEPDQDVDVQGPPDLSWLAQLVTYLVLALLVFGLLWYIIREILPGFRRVKVQRQQATIEEVEDIAELDLQALIKKAEEEANWKEAVRLYFLLALQKLSERNRIKWTREKTNRDYLREMRSTPYFAEFRALIRVFEFAIYGDGEVNRQHFDSVRPRFQGFIQDLK
jgi:hypothetical protein